MNEFWIAVDFDGWSSIAVSKEAPRLNEKTGVYAMSGRSWSMGLLLAKELNLKPGQCRRLALAEETSD